MLDHYGKEENTVDYRDFLLAIRWLQKQGKLMTDQKGLFWVEPHTFREIWENPPKPKATPSFGGSKRALSSVNPLISSSNRRLMVKAFSTETASMSGSKQRQGGRQFIQKTLHGGIAEASVQDNPFGHKLKRAGKSQVNFNIPGNGDNNTSFDVASIQASQSQHKLEKFFS